MLVAAIFTLSALVSAAAASDPVSLRSLTRDCQFTIGRMKFDLCPLFKSAQARKKTIEFERQTPPTVTKVIYDLSLDGPLKRDTTLPEHEQCAQGTWFCMTTINRRPDHRSEAPRILQLVPVVANFSEKDASSAAPASRFSVRAMLGEAHENSPPSLWVHLNGGYYVDTPQKALFQFICDPKAPDPSEPTFGWTFNGTHTFNWKTKHACGSMQAVPSQPKPPPPSEESPEKSPEKDHTPPPPEGHRPPPAPEDDKDKFTQPPPVSDHASRASMMTILLCTTAGFFLVGYILMHPPSSVRQRLAPYVRAFRRSRFRGAISESKLLQWAQDDIDLMDGDEDEMVNAHGEEDVFRFDEQIPLKPSPKHGLKTNYGTAK